MAGWPLDWNRPQSVGKVHSFYGNFGMHVRALAYILALGPDGIRECTENAVLNANYLKARLRDHYDQPYPGHSLHEFVLSGNRQKALGVRTTDIAKRLLDHGFYAPTVYFPLIVAGGAHDRAHRDRRPRSRSIVSPRR